MKNMQQSIAKIGITNIALVAVIIAFIGVIAMLFIPVRSEVRSCGEGGRYSILFGQTEAYEEALKPTTTKDYITENEVRSPNERISEGVCVGSNATISLYLL